MHTGRLENASAAIAALQEGRSSDPAPPPEELFAFDGRNIPAELLALCEGRHLAVHQFVENGSTRKKF
eukprot:7826587-Lingulodinium_polyedra.AAC.1